MGNLTSLYDHTFQQRVNEVIDETRIKFSQMNPFSKLQEQVPYAEPLQLNIYAPNQQTQIKINQIIQSEPIKIPAVFQNDDSYQYDEKYWKKQNPNVVIQGHWFKRTPHGLCRLFFPGGQRLFVCYFHHGVPLFGDCLVIFQKSAYYHGSMKNFKFDGYGKYVNFDNSVQVEGEWQNGVPVGKVNEKIVLQQQIIEFIGEFNQNSQKSGKNSSYTIKNNKQKADVLFQYKGAFENDAFYGSSIIKIANGTQEVKGTFDKDTVEISTLTTQQYEFEGKLDKIFQNGTGKFTDLREKIKATYTGEIKNGLLNGPGTIITQDGAFQKVYWFNGIKLKHLRRFQDLTKLSQLLNRVEQFYSRAKTYTQLTKSLGQYYKSHQVQGSSPHHQQSGWIFEMISRQKVYSISSPKQYESPTLHKAISTQQQTQSPRSAVPKKELIVQLEKEHFLYVICYHRE